MGWGGGGGARQDSITHLDLLLGQDKLDVSRAGHVRCLLTQASKEVPGKTAQAVTKKTAKGSALNCVTYSSGLATNATPDIIIPRRYRRFKSSTPHIKGHFISHVC